MGDYYYDDNGRGSPPSLPPRRRGPPPPPPPGPPKRSFNWGGFLLGGTIAVAAAFVIVGFIRRSRASSSGDDGETNTAPLTSNPGTTPTGPGPAYPPPPFITEEPYTPPMIDPGETQGPIIQEPPPIQTPPPVNPTPGNPPPLDPVLPDQTYNWIPMRHESVKLMNPYGAYSQYGRIVFERPDILQELGPVVTNCSIDVTWVSKLQYQVTITFRIPNDVGLMAVPLDGATAFFPLGGIDNRLMSALGDAVLMSTTYETDTTDDYEIYRTLKWSPAFVYSPSIDTLNALLPKPKAEAVIFNTNLYLKMNVKNMAVGGGRVTTIKAGTATMVYRLK